MNDLNSVIIVGNLTKDIEVKYTQSGSAIGNISIASNRSKKQGDQWVDEVSYFDVVLFGKSVENLQQYLTKGKKVAVQGHLKQDRWKDQQGNNKSKISIISESIQFVGGNNGQKSEDVPPQTEAEQMGFDADVPF